MKRNALYYFWQSSAATGPSKGRLNHHTTYIAKENNKGLWIQVDFGEVAKVTKIGSQGCYYQYYCHREWVSKYTVSYSVHGEYFENQLHKSSDDTTVSLTLQSIVDKLTKSSSWIRVELHPEEAQHFIDSVSEKKPTFSPFAGLLATRLHIKTALLLFVNYPSSVTREQMSVSNFRSITPTRTVQILSSMHWMNQS